MSRLKRVFLLVDDELPILRVCKRALMQRHPLRPDTDINLFSITVESARIALQQCVTDEIEEIRFFAASFDIAILMIDAIAHLHDPETRISVVSDGTLFASTIHLDGIEFLSDLRTGFGEGFVSGILATAEQDLIERAQRLTFKTVHKDGITPLQNTVIPAYEELFRS